ncbi:MAG: hypothetical protein C7N36_18285 [Bacteroidetes bacterium]|nr:MAG: hypothetical protein C7N36_18285 [Bacteroidota bacterium]
MRARALISMVAWLILTTGSSSAQVVDIFEQPVRKVACEQYTVPGSTINFWDWTMPRYKFHYKYGNASSDELTVDSPFHSNSFSFSPNTVHLAFHPGEPNDYQVVDGWELLYRNFGEVDNPVGEPSFGLYNRYDAKVRIFYYLEPNGEAPYQNARVIMSHFSGQGSFTNVSSLFEHLNIPANALSEFDKTALEVSQLNEIIINGTWLLLEFIAAYDPCVCLYPSALEIKPVLSNVQELTFSMRGTGTSTALYTGGATSPASFGAALKTFENLSTALTSGVTVFRDINTYLAQANATNAATVPIAPSKIPAWLATPATFFTKAFGFLVGGGKSTAPSKLSGLNHNFLFTGAGEITTYSNYDRVLLYTPGSYFDQRTPAANRPIYRNALGLFNLLEPPVIEVSRERIESSSPTGEFDIEEHATFRFVGDLKYVVNEIAGISGTPIRLMGSLVFPDCGRTPHGGAPISFYTTPVINIQCLEDYTVAGYFYESSFFKDGKLQYEVETEGCVGNPELQIVAVLDNALNPSADDILFVARYKPRIIEANYAYDAAPVNPYIGLTDEAIHTICNPAPPTPVSEFYLKNFCERLYDPSAKALTGLPGIVPGVIPEFTPLSVAKTINEVVYPNPFTDYISLRIPESWLNQMAVIQLLDVNGHVVYERQMYLETTGQLQLTEGVKNLPAGQYVIRILGDNLLLNDKLIKL